eukprot:170604_1
MEDKKQETSFRDEPGKWMSEYGHGKVAETKKYITDEIGSIYKKATDSKLVTIMAFLMFLIVIFFVLSIWMQPELNQSGIPHCRGLATYLKLMVHPKDISHLDRSPAVLAKDIVYVGDVVHLQCKDGFVGNGFVLCVERLAANQTIDNWKLFFDHCYTLSGEPVSTIVQKSSNTIQASDSFSTGQLVAVILGSVMGTALLMLGTFVAFQKGVFHAVANWIRRACLRGHPSHQIGEPSRTSELTELATGSNKSSVDDDESESGCSEKISASEELE